MPIRVGGGALCRFPLPHQTGRYCCLQFNLDGKAVSWAGLRSLLGAEGSSSLPHAEATFWWPTVPHCPVVRKRWQVPLSFRRVWTFDVSVVQESLGLGGAVPFYSRATAFCFSVVAKLSLALGPRVFSSTRSVRDLLKWFCRSNAIEQGAPRYSRTTCMLVVSCDMPALSAHFCTGVVLSFSRAKSFVAVWYGCALTCEAFLLRRALFSCSLALYVTRFC